MKKLYKEQCSGFRGERLVVHRQMDCARKHREGVAKSPQTILCEPKATPKEGDRVGEGTGSACLA